MASARSSTTIDLPVAADCWAASTTSITRYADGKLVSIAVPEMLDLGDEGFGVACPDPSARHCRDIGEIRMRRAGEDPAGAGDECRPVVGVNVELSGGDRVEPRVPMRSVDLHSE